MASDDNSVISVYQKMKKARATVFLAVLLVCSLLLNLLLSGKVRELKDYVRLIKSEKQLAIGAFVPAFNAKDIDGRTITIDYRSANVPTMLYIFAPDCEWCTVNLPNVKALAAEAQSKCRVLGLSLLTDNLRDYVIENNLNFPVYSELSFAVTSKYRMGGTPHTLVISPEGEVLKNWAGTFEGNLQQDVEEYFDIRLPKLAMH